MYIQTSESESHAQQPHLDITLTSSRSLEINEEVLVIKIGQLMRQLVSNKEKLYLYEDLAARLRRENEELLEKVALLDERVEKMQAEADQSREQAESLSKVRAELEKEKAELEERMGKMEAKLKEASTQDQHAIKKKNKQLSKINQLLEKELKAANNKIIELERSLQQKSCLYLRENINKLKEQGLKYRQDLENTGAVRLKTSYADEDRYRMRAISTKNYYR